MNYVKKFSKINPNKPFLFSYRRCPYAMRARMALLSANISFDAYEISLRDKPLELLKLSPKGTVPVLLYKKQVIDESLEIMLWAYTNSEHSNHLKTLNQIQRVDADRLIHINDSQFKKSLDAYKYEPNDNVAIKDKLFKNGWGFLESIEKHFGSNAYLFSKEPSFADVAIFPFVRQFAYVDLDRFMEIPYIRTKAWFESMRKNDLFLNAMVKPIVIS